MDIWLVFSYYSHTSYTSLFMDIFKISLGWRHKIVKGNGNPFQYSCLENPMDTGAWGAIVYGVAKSQTRLSDWTTIKTYNGISESWNRFMFNFLRNCQITLQNRYAIFTLPPMIYKNASWSTSLPIICRLVFDCLSYGYILWT